MKNKDLHTTRLCALGIFLLLFLFFVAPLTSFANTTLYLSATNESDIKDAFTKANENRSVVVKLENDISVTHSDSVELACGQVVLEGHKLSLDTNFYLKGDSELKLKNIEVVSQNNNAPVADIHDTSKLYLEEGSVLGPSSSMFTPCLVNAMDSSKVFINGATIKDCSSENQGFGAIFVNDSSTLLMSSGTIKNCKSLYGAIHLQRNAQFSMNGGSIVGCEAKKYGGGAINLVDSASFTMNAGTLSENTGEMGGAIFEYTNSKPGVTINGGTITNNHATFGAGIMSYKGNLTVNTGSAIYNNQAQVARDIYFANKSNTATLTLGKACDKIMSCGHKIDGWYNDNPSWSCKDAQLATPIQPGTYTTPQYLVAAHSLYSIKVINGTSNKSTAVPGETVEITAQEPHLGKVFDKWVVKGNIVINLEDNMSASTTFKMPKEDVEIQAVYKDKEEQKHLVVLNLCYPNSSPITKYIKDNEMLDLKDPKRDNYKFIGWYKDEGLTQPFDTSSKITSDMELFAKWEKIEQKDTEHDKPSHNNKTFKAADTQDTAISISPLLFTSILLLVLGFKTKRC